jgi:hypothetical protein
MISINKTYRTRDGREVRIYATDGAECLPVHGAIKWVTGKGWEPDIAGWRPCSWTKNGKAVDGEEFSCDLIEVKPRIQRTVWVNVYPTPIFTGAIHFSKKIADQNAMSTRLACVKVEIDCEEGEGL